MKILRLDLQAFGPFTNVALDLSAGSHGLHVIYGPNEAGKTSALRALRQMLYGIPARSTDDFVWPFPRLRIGAVVRHSDGTELAFVRRKGNKNTIRKVTDDSPLPDGWLERFLGNLDADLFATMFGIGHEALVEGGRQIAEGGGHFGEMLFAASAGLADLRGVQERLKRDMDALFLPKGEKPTINKCLSDFHEAQANVRKLQLSSDEWRRHEGAFQKAREERDQLEKESREQNRELNRLTRICNALPLIAERKQLQTEWQGCRDAVLLSDDFAKQRREETTALVQARRDAEGSQKDMAAPEAQLALLVVPEALLAQAEAVEALHQRLGQYQTDLLQLPTRDLQRRTLEHEAKEILRSLGWPPELEQAEHLRLRRDEPVEILNLGNRHQGLLVEKENAIQAVEALRAGLDLAQRNLETAAVLPEETELRAAIRQALELGAIERDLNSAEAELAQAERQAAVELSRLPHWQGSWADVECLPVPPAETVDRYEKAFLDVDTGLSALDGRIAEKAGAVQNLKVELRQLELQQEVPTEDDLRDGRRRREAGWRLVLQSWREGRDDAEAAAVFVAESAPARDLAQAYETSVRHADVVADRLRREADRVARKASLLAQRDLYQEQLGNLTRESDETKVRQERLMRDWLAAMQLLPLPESAPSEARAWIRQQNDLVRKAQALREKQERIERLRTMIAANRSQLGGCLQRVHEPPPRDDEALAALIERSQSVLERSDEGRRRRDELTRDIADLEQKLSNAQAAALRTEKELARWQEGWTAAMNRLRMESTARPEAANAILAGITELFQKLREADGFRRRIDGMKRDMGRFEQDVRELALRVAPQLAALPADRAAAELFLHLGQARAAQQKRQALQDYMEKATQKIRKSNEEAVRASSRLEALRLEAGCAAVDELQHAEERSARRRQVEKDLTQCDARLRTFSAGAPVEMFVAEAEQVDADLLPGRIDPLKVTIAKLQVDMGVVNQTIGAEGRELERMDGSAAAVEEAEKAETLLAQLHRDVPHYAALRLAAVVLQKGIERYREKNQGPVLAGASRRFADLTCGSFGRPRSDGKSDEIGALRIDYDDAGAAVLVGVRPGGQETVGVEGMSDGSRDQLYLALRLASLETWLESHEPIPFIVDDVLLNFDDERATAALKSFADLSRRTQIIFFTHHEHMVRLATGCLAEDTVFMHRLPDRPQQRTVVQVM